MFVNNQQTALNSADVFYCDTVSHMFRPVIRPSNTRRRHIPQCDVSTALYFISTWYSAIKHKALATGRLTIALWDVSMRTTCKAEAKHWWGEAHLTCQASVIPADGTLMAHQLTRSHLEMIYEWPNSFQLNLHYYLSYVIWAFELSWHWEYGLESKS